MHPGRSQSAHALYVAIKSSTCSSTALREQEVDALRPDAPRVVRRDAVFDEGIRMPGVLQAEAQLLDPGPHTIERDRPDSLEDVARQAERIKTRNYPRELVLVRNRRVVLQQADQVVQYRLIRVEIRMRDDVERGVAGCTAKKCGEPQA